MSEEARDARLGRLLKKARSLPGVPGVYLMKDASGTVVYVGKASRLPDRLSSYFVPSAELGARKQPMLEVVSDFDAIECESAWEALLTEARLVKDLKPTPRFNTRLKDGKTFPYLVVTQGEDYPRVFVTRNPSEHGGGRSGGQAEVFGPFTSAGALREAVSVLQRVFKFRTCSLDIVAGDEKNRHFRPCILASIDQCTAPCAERISPTLYGQDIERFTRFLGTKQGVMLRELRAEMGAASAALDFERAAKLRDQVKLIEKLSDRASVRDGWQPETEIAPIDAQPSLKSLQKLLNLPVPIRCVEGFDIAHLQGNQTVASKVCFIDARPFKEGYRRFKIGSVGNDDYSALAEVVGRRYREAGAGHELYPEVILIDGGLGQLNAAMSVFDALEVRPPMVVSLAKKEELIFVQRESEPVRVSRSHLGLRLLQAVRDEAHRFAQAYHHLLRRKLTLEEE